LYTAEQVLDSGAPHVADEVHGSRLREACLFATPVDPCLRTTAVSGWHLRLCIACVLE